MGSSYKFDLTLSEDGSGGAHIALFEANAGAKISEIVEKVFFRGKDLTIWNSCGVSVIK